MSYNTIDEVNYLLGQSIDNIVKTSDSLRLIKCYSTLYLYGSQPRWCEKSQRSYYYQIETNGLKLAMDFEESKTRICKPAWKGLKFICVPGKAFHLNSEFVTDAKAIEYLAIGYLQKSDFEILPTIKTVIDQDPLTNQEPKKVIRKRK
jgi:hypothetical protein